LNSILSTRVLSILSRKQEKNFGFTILAMMMTIWVKHAFRPNFVFG